jgi:DNA (cytosine-5)-methyltransferase 1
MAKYLNLYAGLGGNIELVDDTKHEIVNVEIEPKIAAVLQKRKPNQKVIVADAHQFLLDNHNDFDFVWSSPPCQTHSKMMKFTRHKQNRYSDMSLYQEIVFLKHFFKGQWVVENVKPYYEPLIKPSAEIGRHLFWSNFEVRALEVKQPKNFINTANLQGKKEMMDWLGIHYDEVIYYKNNHCPVQILRNCVHPKMGLDIFQNRSVKINEDLFSSAPI